MGWEEFYSRYKVLFPNIDQNLHVALFNHYIWEKQISKFKHALTLDFNSFKNLDGFIDDRSNFVTLKQQKNSQVLNRAKKNPNINFNIFEKFYFFV